MTDSSLSGPSSVRVAGVEDDVLGQVTRIAYSCQCMSLTLLSSFIFLSLVLALPLGPVGGKRLLPRETQPSAIFLSLLQASCSR